MSWFASDNKIELKRVQAADKLQKKKLKEELEQIEDDHAAKVSGFESRINESSQDLNDARARFEFERRNKEKEIENEKVKNQEQIEALEQSFLRSKAEAGNESKERLKELQAKNKEERNELIAAQKKRVEEKKQELVEIKAQNQVEMKKIEEDHKKILQERKDELKKHTQIVADIRAEHNKKYINEKNELLKIKQEVLEKQRLAIKSESEKTTQECENLLRMQAMNINGGFERDLADGVTHMLEPFSRSVEACKQLQEPFADLEKEEDTALLFIKNATSEWEMANGCTSKATLRLRKLINNYTSINPKFRQEVQSAMNAIDKNIMDVQALPMAINRAVGNKDIEELKVLQKTIEQEIRLLENMAETARQICAPHDGTIQMIVGSNGQEGGVTPAIEQQKQPEAQPIQEAAHDEDDREHEE